MIRVGSNIRIQPNPMCPDLAGYTGTVIWRRGQKWVRVRLDVNPRHGQLAWDGKGWLLPQSAVQPC